MDRRHFLRTGAMTAGGLVVGVGVLERSFADGTGTRVITDLGGTVGVTEHDLDPRKAVLGTPSAGELLIDQDYRSVGIDLGRIVTPNAIRLSSDRASHRLNSRDLAVYTSANGHTWTRRPSEFVDLGTTIWLYGLETPARYAKVHSYRDGDSAHASFGNADPRQLVRAFAVPSGAFVGGSGAWSHRIAITINNPGSQAVADRAAYVSHQALRTSALISQGILRADLADLRFADANGHQLHAYDDGDGIFVRIPSLDPKQSIVIYAYVGNPEAESVLADAGALQVEYGHRTYQPQAAKSEAGLAIAGEVHPVALPDGTLMITAGTTAAGGIHARYSRNGGRTWSAPEPLIPASDPSKGADRPGGYLVDPVTGAVTAVLYSVGHSSGKDWTDPAQHLCQIWISRATSYDAEGRPVFEAPQHQPIMNAETGDPASWAITYTNPVRTRAGAYVVTVGYIFRPDGQFALAVLRSVDQGRTWSQPVTLTSPDSGTGLEAGPSESTVNQFPSGRLVIIVRHQELTRYYFATSHSDDDGRTWSPLMDSPILASNTAPDLLARESGMLLSWSGHNAFGQTSYYRNNFTIAYSTDDGHQFEKYHDMTGATSLSTPGWASSTQQRQMQESFIVPAGSDDLLIAGEFGGSSNLAGGSILIEDIDEYLHKSHGALDVIRYRDDGGVADGKELSQSRWWRTASPGEVVISDGVKPGRTAVRLTTAAGEKRTGVSRLFPGSRQARVRFWLRWDAIGSNGANLALQEGFSNTGNAHGAIALFQLGPDGTVEVASDDVYDAVPKGGYIEADTNPAVGNLMFSNGPAALDYNNRSVGLYLGGNRDVTGLVLTGAPQYATGGTSTRLEPSDLGVWISDTNNSDWTQVAGWGGTKDGLTITLTGPTFKSTFVKVTQPYGDKAFTFANTIPPLIAPVPDLQEAQTFRPLQVPTQLDAQRWHRVEVDVDLDADRIITAIDGKTVSRLGSVHPAHTMTHLMVMAGDGGGTDLRIAELIVQDTSQDLPVVGRVSSTSRIE